MPIHTQLEMGNFHKFYGINNTIQSQVVKEDNFNVLHRQRSLTTDRGAIQAPAVAVVIVDGVVHGVAIVPDRTCMLIPVNYLQQIAEIMVVPGTQYLSCHDL